jgi:hypothetical protein
MVVHNLASHTSKQSRPLAIGNRMSIAKGRACKSSEQQCPAHPLKAAHCPPKYPHTSSSLGIYAGLPSKNHDSREQDTKCERSCQHTRAQQLTRPTPRQPLSSIRQGARALLASPHSPLLFSKHTQPLVPTKRAARCREEGRERKGKQANQQQSNLPELINIQSAVTQIAYWRKRKEDCQSPIRGKT